MGRLKNMKTALVFGSNSDIAKAAINLLETDYNIVRIDRSVVDLASADAETKINKLLSTYQPDVVIQCGGVFQDNNLTSDFDTTFDINVKSHWSIIRHYIDNPPEKQVNFVMIGSSTYKQGRRNFILYAASRAAQFSMWQGAMEYCSANFVIGLINPVRVNTKHVAHIKHPNPEICLEAEDVAQEIVNLCTATTSQCIDMDYKKKETL
jgi:NAD(P)-dependent dehydrogenase (short-subunit alcohol dehydrogenase family)